MAWTDTGLVFCPVSFRFCSNVICVESMSMTVPPSHVPDVMAPGLRLLGWVLLNSYIQFTCVLGSAYAFPGLGCEKWESCTRSLCT